MYIISWLLEPKTHIYINLISLFAGLEKVVQPNKKS